MTAEQFYKLVRQMRLAQRNYFNTKSQFWLKQSIMLEKNVDDEITRVDEILQRKYEEGNLF